MLNLETTLRYDYFLHAVKLIHVQCHYSMYVLIFFKGVSVSSSNSN